MSAAAIPTTAPPALWRVARAFLDILYNLFGAPEDVAFRHTLTREPYKLLLSWLRVGEAMMRRLIAIEAAAFPKPNTPPLLHAKRPRTRRARGFDHDKPEDWRVSFRVMERGRPRPRHSPSVTRARTPHTRFRSAWPLAERYEALIRVLNDPLPYARRLAARLHAQPHRIHEALRAPPEYEHRVDHADDFTRTAERAWTGTLNSS